MSTPKKCSRKGTFKDCPLRVEMTYPEKQQYCIIIAQVGQLKKFKMGGESHAIGT